VAASWLFQWRKLDRQGALTAVSTGEAVAPASELAAARAEIAKLQRVLGKKTLENEILKEAVECAAAKSGWRARPCCPGTNSSADIAAETRALARSLGLRPINTPVCSPQSNGIAEHFNEAHPHPSLKMRSPREFRRHPAAQARRSTVQEAALHCEWDGSGDMGARSLRISEDSR
jgi:transposase InsO family protein